MKRIKDVQNNQKIISRITRINLYMSLNNIECVWFKFQLKLRHWLNGCKKSRPNSMLPTRNSASPVKKHNRLNVKERKNPM